ncbi:MAG: PRC-barrel domain-containing protein [Anaerolineae bacterium]|nr:PRC-barrel domain-containing protein [Anaerolineae bacterium]
MLKGSDLIGLPVVAADTGRIPQMTQDIVMSPGKDRLLGLLTDKGGWLSRAQVIPWFEVISAGVDAVVIRSQESIVEARDMPEAQRVLEGTVRLRGARMCTTDGVNLGVITDLFFHRQTGATEGYEVCGRLPEEASSHCAFVAVGYPLRLEPPTAWVAPEVADVVRRQIEDVRRIKLHDTGQSRDDPVAAKEMRDSTLSSMVEMARGRSLLWDIRGPEGWLIAARGQQVTEAVFERALAENRVRELLRAANVTWNDQAAPSRPD